MSLFPYFAYRDAAAAVDWLVAAFGFEVAQDYRGPDGAVMHAELRVGSAAIMLGTATEEQRAQEPWDLPEGHGVYVHVEDVDGHHARARAAGAQVVFGPEDTEWGTRRYRARDLEGYEWSFGSYRPGGS